MVAAIVVDLRAFRMALLRCSAAVCLDGVGRLSAFGRPLSGRVRVARLSTATSPSSATYNRTETEFSASSSSASSSAPFDARPLLSRRALSPLSVSASRGSVLDLYRKLCRVLPQVLRGYELEGEDSYHRALRNIRFHFEHHRALSDRHVVEVLRHKAEMEIEEALLMYKTKSHIATLVLQEPALASVARASKEARLRQQPSARPQRTADRGVRTAAVALPAGLPRGHSVTRRAGRAREGEGGGKKEWRGTEAPAVYTERTVSRGQLRSADRCDSLRAPNAPHQWEGVAALCGRRERSS